jgi:hypothetical protein
MAQVHSEPARQESLPVCIPQNNAANRDGLRGAEICDKMKEITMQKSTHAIACLAAIAGAAMLTMSMTPASAFTLASPSLAQPLDASQIEHIWYDRWGHWHPNGYTGYGHHYGYGYAHHYGYGHRYYRYGYQRAY